jgi:hypothetical protein
MSCPKYVSYQSNVLAQIQPFPVAGHHARRVLATMLQYGKTVEQALVNGATTNDADDSAH